VTSPDFATAVERLLTQVGHWEQSRWWTHVPAAASPPALSSPPAPTSRWTEASAPATARPPAAAGYATLTKGDLLYVLVQRLADLGADAEHRPHRPVPRLNDLALPDQLRVVADDLLAAAPPAPTLKLAAEETTTTHRSL
jgi:hypothetical protein